VVETRRPLVSVAMPIYNAQRTVAAAIRSILGQSVADWELLIVNDGSTDGTIDVVRSFRDPRIRVWSDDRNLGLSVRLNETIQQSRGTYYARMDGDDVAYPQRLERQLAFMQANPDLDLVGAWIMVFGEDGVPLGKRTARHDPDSRNVLRTIPVGHPTFLGKLDWFRRRDYMPSVRFIQDQQLLLQTIEQRRIGVVPEILLGYREEALTIRKQVKYRWEYVTTYPDMVRNLGVWRATSLLGLQLVKLSADVVAIGTGLNYRILRHRAEPATAAEQQQWQSVWESVR
jgi:glycosyltransferase involved in cell wall biosynthesis